VVRSHGYTLPSFASPCAELHTLGASDSYIGKQHCLLFWHDGNWQMTFVFIEEIAQQNWQNSGTTLHYTARCCIALRSLQCITGRETKHIELLEGLLQHIDTGEHCHSSL
jgi:hypothetical protein